MSEPFETEFVCPCGCIKITCSWKDEAMNKLLDVDLVHGDKQVYDADGDLVLAPRDVCPTGLAEGQKMIELRRKWFV
ncbi:MAG TPA: hypothetical protein VEB88_00205 [Candidatus Acidoferrales bacterium]|nr:hypothetical protein [Candidatus Acidoferrales bacterium]